MVRKEEETSKGDNSIHSECTTESSDSYSYLLRDVENPNNHINEEWDAIERTLYQESGKHVTDPVLLKECKLWRETFPHIRVRGTAIKVEQPEEDLGLQSTKSVEAIDKNHIALSKLNEKREKIKKTVVSHIVERLINKLNVNKENSVSKTLIELDGEGGRTPNLNTKSSGTQSEKESYFERGKKVDTRGKVGKSPEERVPSGRSHTDDASDDLEYNFSTDYLKNGNKTSLWSGYSYNEKPISGREYTSKLPKNEEILRSGNITFKIAEKNSKRGKASDPPSADIKPFEITKKIDKKYEAMLERILESKGFGVGGSDAKKSPKPEISSYRESVKKHNRDDLSYRKNKQLPKLNNFTNNWMNRGDQRLHDSHGIIPRNLFPVNHGDPVGSVKSREKHTKFQSSRSASNAYQCEEKFLEEIRREMGDYTISVRKDYEEEINLIRPRFYNRYNKNNTARTQKSSSCGDLPKKNPKSCNRTLKNGLEKGKSELTVRSGNKKSGKSNKNQKVQLPPIETSIICTEIIGRPKIASRTLPKKYI